MQPDFYLLVLSSEESEGIAICNGDDFARELCMRKKDSKQATTKLEEANAGSDFFQGSKYK